MSRLSLATRCGPQSCLAIIQGDGRLKGRIALDHRLIGMSTIYFTYSMLGDCSQIELYKLNDICRIQAWFRGEFFI